MDTPFSVSITNIVYWQHTRCFRILIRLTNRSVVSTYTGLVTDRHSSRHAKVIACLAKRVPSDGGCRCCWLLRFLESHRGSVCCFLVVVVMDHYVNKGRRPVITGHCGSRNIGERIRVGSIHPFHMGKVICRVRHWRQYTAAAHRLLICRCNPNGSRHVLYGIFHCLPRAQSVNSRVKLSATKLTPSLFRLAYLFKLTCVFLYEIEIATTKNLCILMSNE